MLSKKRKGSEKGQAKATHPKTSHSIKNNFHRQFAPTISSLFSEKKNVHDHHRKRIIWGTFLASKKNFPGRWWIQKPYKTNETNSNHIYHRNLSSVAPIFFGKEKFLTGAGRCMQHMFFFSPVFFLLILKENDGEFAYCSEIDQMVTGYRTHGVILRRPKLHFSRYTDYR